MTGRTSETDVTHRYTVQSWCVRSSKGRSERVGPSPMVSARSSILTLRARASTPNAHYTSPEIVRAIWQAMERFGLQPGAHILEPSMGVGHFFGLMPEGLYPSTRRTGVELDSVTARIAANLYPESIVHRKAFADTPFPKDYFNAAVGNILFGNYPVYDPAYRGSPYLTHASRQRTWGSSEPTPDQIA